MNAIKLENVNYYYSKGTPFEKKALDNINLEIPEGEITGIIGHTGSGKSTLISTFNGLNKPDSGKVSIFGEDIWKDKNRLKEFRFKVGLVFQYPEYQLFEETIYKDIAFGPKNMGLSESEIDERVKEAIKAVGLDEEVLNHSPFDISGGQKRRVAIAGVLAMRPKILVLDEPSAGLDPKGRDIIFSLILSYHKKTNNTTLFVSHSMDDVAKYCQKALVINDGKIFDYGSISEVYKKADELSKMGLNVPQVTYIINELNKLGFNLDNSIYTLDDAVDMLYKKIKEVKSNA